MGWSIGDSKIRSNIFSICYPYFRAIDKASNSAYAVKIIENHKENIEDILQEYKILLEHSLHPNIPLLFGAYR